MHLQELRASFWGILNELMQKDHIRTLNFKDPVVYTSEFGGLRKQK